MSIDGSGQLEADIDAYVQSSSYEENVHFDLSKIDKRTAAIVLFVDGGPRNFQFVQSIIVHCSQENLDSDTSNFMSKVEPGAYSNTLLFESQHRTRKDYQGVVLNVLFREGWNADGTAQWHIKNVFEPLYVPTSREKQERCAQLVVATVPALAKYRPRLFPTVKAICSALSSTALPKLKKCFQKGNGLPVRQFTEVLFTQLYETHPRVAEDVEASYTVALLQDMFSQIDFNGDGAVDWDEFTTFCIHTGLVGTSGAAGAVDGPSAMTRDSLDEYVIEYGEDKEIQDHVLNSYSPVAGMTYIPSTKRIMVTPEKRDCIMMFNDTFEHVTTLHPSTLNTTETTDKLKVYDIVFIASRDMYVYCASDHTLVACKEKSSPGGKKIHYTVVTRIFSSYLHVKLCWSEGSKILCSVAADNVVYGWDLEGNSPIFQVSRHKDLITDFIAIDSMDIFVTCSLDKRIVLWSQVSRRVKGVLLGHKRGVRSLSYGRGILLSAGFECEARTWDINLKEPTLILKGHRMPIAAARMMCAADQSDDNLRALTVDDGGEFRLWNVFVKEKGSQCGFAQVLQVFTTSPSEPQVGRIRFFELPFESPSSKGNYSNIIAASSKLIHIIPEKNCAEFIPPTCVSYSEPNACVVIAVGHSMYKYDVSAGCFHASINELDGTDVTSLALDGEYGRRIFVGCTSGNIMLLNFATGAVLDSVAAHTKEVTAIAVVKSGRTEIYSGSFDGRIRCMEENSGQLLLHNTLENAFGDGSGITSLKAVDSIRVVVAASSGKMWGVWNMAALKKILIMEERDPVSSIEVLGASGDKEDIDRHTQLGLPMGALNYMTVAVCTLSGIRVYSLDTFLGNIAITHHLTHDASPYISGMILLHCPQHGSVNYTLNQATSCARFGTLVVAVSDEGFVLVWNAGQLRQRSMQTFQLLFPEEEPVASSQHASRKNSRSSAVSDVRDKTAVMPVVDAPPTSTQNSTDGIATTGSSLAGNAAAAPEEHEGDEDTQNCAVFSLTSTAATAATADPASRISSSPSPSKRRRKRRRAKGEANKASHNSMRESLFLCNSMVLGEETIVRETSIKSWRAHVDIIQSVVPLHEHGCFVTTSLDGFSRIWNLDSDCLGELPLPNVTEAMKAKRVNGEFVKWKFVMEKIPVTKSHVEIAKRLVRLVTSEAPPPKDEKDRRKAGAVGGLCSHDMSVLKSLSAPPVPKKVKKTITSDERDILRREMLMKLNEIDDTCRDTDEATVASCTRHGSDDHSLNTVTHASGAKIMKGKLGSDGMSVQSLTSDMSLSQRSFASASSLWLDAESLGSITSAPFSESSITVSHQEGLIDAEGHKILRRVNADKDKVDAYNRSVPTVEIRNVAMSTRVVMPPLGSQAESEVSFGTQKLMYKNANKCYADKRKYSSAQARHVMSLSRIKTNVRRIGNMINIKEPPTHDLVSLPPIKGTGEDDDEDEEEVERERKRLVYNALSRSQQGSRHFGSGDLQHGEKREVNREKVVALMKRVNDAETTGLPDWELRQQKVKVGRVQKKVLHRSNTAAEVATALLEKRLSAAIRNSYRNVMDGSLDKKILTPRMLLPFYKMSDVKHFLDIFQKVDEDYSGMCPC